MRTVLYGIGNRDSGWQPYAEPKNRAQMKMYSSKMVAIESQLKQQYTLNIHVEIVDNGLPENFPPYISAVCK